MKIYENSRIRVTLTDEQFEQFGGGRATILSHAMVVLGNRSEAALLDVENEQPIDAEIRTSALENIMVDYLAEHAHYNVNDILSRMMAGRIMSQGMERDIEIATAFATTELRENPNHPELATARESLVRRIEDEKKYRKSRANSGWQIEIIGPMPTQIGMCRYQAVAA